MQDLSLREFKEVMAELHEKIKFSILINEDEVYVTDIIIDNKGRLKVEFITKDPEKEDELRPHVEACIMKLIRDEEAKQCKSRKPFSQISSTIKNSLRWLFRT